MNVHSFVTVLVEIRARDGKGLRLTEILELLAEEPRKQGGKGERVCSRAGVIELEGRKRRG